MSKRILIVNRGEIAVRIIRACRDLGYSPIALFSPLDADALHVRMADAAVSVPSYLDHDAILAAATQVSADGIHPGYGFLAENDAFARRVQQQGITWIGPSPAVIAQLGSKVAARKLAEAAGVPILPGTIDPVTSVAAAQTAAEDIGFPLMLKAVAGGGGKGMRIVESPDNLASAFELAQGEARSSFGDNAIYLERYVPAPHHIEVQLLADQHGTVLHCGERECSVQRRHQKLIEEAPSPFLHETTRSALCAAAVSLAQQAQYDSVGTVEFLVDAEQQFYFLEVNTRIQVEHPITEMITGIDLVANQIRVAFGEQLSLTQNDITFHGHAIECRVCAEDHAQNFMPAPGKITTLCAAQGPGVRFDSGAENGTIIHGDYDPLIAKLCTWGRDRGEAIARMQRALQDTNIAGLITNNDFHQRALRIPAFLDGCYDTSFIAQHREQLCAATSNCDTTNRNVLLMAALARALQQHHSAPSMQSTWREHARRSGVCHED